MKLVFQSFLIVVTFIFIFLWELTPLSDYTIPFLVAVAIAFGIYYFLNRNKSKDISKLSYLGILLMSVVLILTIDITGNLYSPLFFLIYFLIFGLGLVFEPITVFIFAIGTLAVFLPPTLINNSLESYIKLFSMIIVAPLAFFFAKEMKKKSRIE